MRLAWADLAATARHARLIGALAWLDVRLRYRGSWLGPFWLSLSTAISVGALGMLYPLLFHLPARGYVPYLAVSLVLWTALGQLVADASGAFAQQEAMILTLRLPLGLHAARVLLRNAIALAHHAAVLVPVLLFLRSAGGAPTWFALPALALWLVDGFALVLALGLLSARFRDIPPIAASALQLSFFVTPVLWQARQLGRAAGWLVANPLHAMLEVLRAPLLGVAPAAGAWPVALAVSVSLVTLTFVLFAHARPHLAFWI